MTQGSATHRPLTIDVEQAMATLSYAEMKALSGMFARWAVNEKGLDDRRRARLIEMAADYLYVADRCGPSWLPTAPVETPLSVIAKAELQSR